MVGDEIRERQEMEPNSPRMPRRPKLDSVSAEGTNKGSNVERNK